jgi:hypothetical protein
VSAVGKLTNAMRSLRLAPILAALSLDTACALPPATLTPVGVQAPSGSAASTATPPAPAPLASIASAAPTPGASASSGPTQPPPTPPAFQEALDDASKALDAGDLIGADKHIETAAVLAGDDAHLAYLVARLRATRFVETGDFERAAAALVAVIPVLARRPELADEFWSHNAMMMIREAQGDPAAALAENDQATLCATRGTWDPERRATLAFQKDRWHRAYLTRMLAESRAGSVKQALVQYARAALDEYQTQGGFPDSVAVLEAYFAALDGKREEALAAARRVDPAKDDDVEDLYLVVVGLDAGGDRTAAEGVRRVMRRPGPGHFARAIMLRWLDLDAKGGALTGSRPGKRPRAEGFTPGMDRGPWARLRGCLRAAHSTGRPSSSSRSDPAPSFAPAQNLCAPSLFSVVRSAWIATEEFSPGRSRTRRTRTSRVWPGRLSRRSSPFRTTASRPG